ncbi:MAG TPA: GspE/PulE family protein [Candidatus Paceibacterota bacterium]|nr:GspE/PulE family protein [Candidatus Paceibacterota bacterium]
MITFNDDKQVKQLKELRDKDSENLAQMLAAKYGFKYADLTLTPINLEALRIVPEKIAQEAQVAPYNVVAHRLDLAVLSPNLPKTVEVIADLEQKGYQVTKTLVSNNSLEIVWKRYKELSFSEETQAGALEIAGDQLQQFLESVHSLEDVRKMIEEKLGGTGSLRNRKTSSILEIILAGGLATGASDIHLEPEEEYARLRYRIDGVLTDIMNFDSHTYTLLLSRIKLLSGLKLNIHENAQDGRFSIKIKESEIEIRTSALPGAYNESLVMRILNPDSISVPLEALGIEPHLLSVIMHELSRPNGLILTTGPTGSGKTTALYAFIRKIHSQTIKIITIENPIEYHLPGIVQTQTDTEKGYTFLSGLRSALRQDPDVIMVGEIRDQETAEIAVNAALTGHLVFSTLHTNNAAGTFPRLIDLGIDTKILSSAISISMAQRLARKLCENCKKEQPINNTDKALFERILKNLARPEEVPQREKIWTAAGCEKCNHTGYKGRVGLYEAILMNEAIEQVLRNNPSEREIWKAALPQGINTIQQDGVIKVLRGVTSLDELERVIDLDQSWL